MKYSKKILALVLTTAFSLNTVSVVDAAPTRDQIEALRAEIKELTEVLKVEKAKHKYEKQQAERSGNNAAWNLHGDLRYQRRAAGQNGAVAPGERVYHQKHQF